MRLNTAVTCSNTRFTNTTDLSEFTGCTWNLTFAGNGGAISFTGSASLTVTSCLFNLCNSTDTYGGAIYFKSTGSVTVKSNTKFWNCTSTSAGGVGGALYINGTGVRLFENCNFEECKQSQCGATTLENIGNGATFTNCNWIKCQSTGSVNTFYGLSFTSSLTFSN
jgi:hypothetical protein